MRKLVQLAVGPRNLDIFEADSGGERIDVGLRAGEEGTRRDMTWTVRTSPGNLAVRETLTVRNGLFPRMIEVRGNGPLVALPMVSAAGRWFELGDRLLLDERGGGSWYVGRQEARAPRAYFSRVATIAEPLEGGEPTGPGTRVEKGYVVEGSQRGPVLTGWIADQPEGVRAALSAWYGLRFWGGRAYVLKTARGDVRVLDMGEK